MISSFATIQNRRVNYSCPNVAASIGRYHTCTARIFPLSIEGRSGPSPRGNTLRKCSVLYPWRDYQPHRLINLLIRTIVSQAESR